MLPLLALVVTASSTYPTENGVSYGAKQLVDGRAGTAWIEGDRGSGLGAFVELKLPEARELRGVKVWNGYWASSDLWARHNRIKDLEITFADGSKASFTLKDTQAAETLIFPKPVATGSLKLKIKSVYAGTTFGDTPLSEVQLLDTLPVAPTVPAGVMASSTYPVDADASYEATNLLDGLVDTAWCANDPKAHGVGQWLEFTFPGATSISSVNVVNGNGASVEENAATTQPTAVSILFDGGAVEGGVLVASPERQTLPFPAHVSSKVRLTVTESAKGAAYDDLCVSEVTFGGP